MAAKDKIYFYEKFFYRSYWVLQLIATVGAMTGCYIMSVSTYPDLLINSAVALSFLAMVCLVAALYFQRIRYTR